MYQRLSQTRRDSLALQTWWWCDDRELKFRRRNVCLFPRLERYNRLGRTDANRLRDPNRAVQIDASTTLLQFIETFQRRRARFGRRISDFDVRMDVFRDRAVIKEISRGAGAQPRRGDAKS